ncbi:hypothetical protein [Bradyrhizobium sp. 2S1]|uniref:hypothetical protein n=1 Tax=Bradyrhizobium sp. 2S1 TaxID=1404429 RepID=UPI0030CCF41C
MIAGEPTPAPVETQKPAVIAAVPAPAVAAAPPAPKRPLPTAYGVYAESGGRLYELQLIQGRAPDPRVAISAAITRPSETALPDGHLRFIVFRREGSSGASDPIDVRLIARVNQQTTFDATGKPVVSPGDDTWVIRNISIPFRAAPLSEDPQMFEVQPRDDAPLSPGRYALILKAQAYDFTVEGAVTDKRHCLQRLAAANGVSIRNVRNRERRLAPVQCRAGAADGVECRRRSTRCRDGETVLARSLHGLPVQAAGRRADEWRPAALLSAMHGAGRQHVRGSPQNRLSRNDALRSRKCGLGRSAPAAQLAGCSARDLNRPNWLRSTSSTRRPAPMPARPPATLTTASSSRPWRSGVSNCIASSVKALKTTKSTISAVRRG